MSPDDHWDLWRRDPRATPFQSPAWVEAWWAEWGGGERHDLVARDDAGQLVAALPAQVWHDRGVRRLIPVAAGQSDYADALLDPAAGPAALAGLWAAAAAVADRWDELLLPDLRPGSPLLGPLPAGWTATDEPGEVCPVLALPRGPDGGGGDVLAALSRSRRRKLVHDGHRAAALGGVAVAFASRDAVAPALAALFDLHAARWALDGQPGVLADPRVQRFLNAAAPALDAAGLLRLAVVRHAGAPVAVLLGLDDGRRAMSYVIGTAFVPGQSFGTLAFRAAVERAAAEGREAFHFLRGEEPYKYAWGAEPTRTVRRTVRRG